MLTGCVVVPAAAVMNSGVVVVVVVVTALVVVVGLDKRIQQRTPRLRLRAPSTPTPTCKGASGLLFITSDRKILASAYSTPLRGMKISKPESGVTAVAIFWL